MGYKKFVLWIIIFFGYLGFLHLLSTPVESSISGIIKKGYSGGAVVVPGVSNVVSVQVIRAPREYWFGVIKAPAYVLGMNIDSLNHLVIDYTLPVLLLVFIVWEVIIHSRKGRISSSIPTGGSGYSYLKKMEGMGLVKKRGKEGKNMEKSAFMNKGMLMVLVRGLAIGILLAFFAFILGDSPAIAILLLVIYIELKFRKKEKYI